MAICSYVVIPAAGSGDAVAGRLSALPGCEVVRAENHEVLLLVTDTPDREAEDALRRRIESIDGIAALMLSFGEITPDEA